MEVIQVPQTSSEEMKAILEQQKIEAIWYKSVVSFETEGNVHRAIEAGELVEVEDGEWFKISERVREEFRALRPETADLLEDIASAWAEKMTEAGENMERTFLVISSLVRTVEYQRELQAKGYPAADGEQSTHTKGGAFDIAIVWFEKNRPAAAKKLREVLQYLSRPNVRRLSFIDEPTVGALHVAAYPR